MNYPMANINPEMMQTMRERNAGYLRTGEWENAGEDAMHLLLELDFIHKCYRALEADLNSMMLSLAREMTTRKHRRLPRVRLPRRRPTTLRRIADALERIANAMEPTGMMPMKMIIEEDQ